jgi:hypothetical protein
MFNVRCSTFIFFVNPWYEINHRQSFFRAPTERLGLQRLDLSLKLKKGLLTVLFPMPSKKIVLGDLGGFDRFGEPCHIDKMLPVDIFGGDVPTPGAAAQSYGRRHAIPQISTG